MSAASPSPRPLPSAGTPNGITTARGPAMGLYPSSVETLRTSQPIVELFRGEPHLQDVFDKAPIAFYFVPALGLMASRTMTFALFPGGGGKLRFPSTWAAQASSSLFPDQ